MRSAHSLGRCCSLLFATACASASSTSATVPSGPASSATEPDSTKGTGAVDPSQMFTFEDPARSFSIDFFTQPHRKDAPPSDGTNGRATGYVLVAGAEERAQLLQLLDLELSPDVSREHTGCRAMLPRIFEGFTRDEADCESVEEVKLLEHDAAGVYSITAIGRSCLEIAGSTTYVHTVCDERIPARRLFFVLLGAGNDKDDPYNRRYVCSLALSGKIVTCPWM